MQNNQSKNKTSFSSLIAVIGSVIVALFILLVFILPAEFGKDFTGLGAKFGINNMSSDALTDTPAPSTSTPAPSTPVTSGLANVVDTSNDPDRIEGSGHTLFSTPIQFMQDVVILEANGHGEFKFDLQTGYQVNYVWSVEGENVVYSDLHGHTPESEDEETEEILVNYLDSQEDNSLSGQFIAGLTGDHGWYFLNLEDKEIRINIQASGHWDSYEFLPLESTY